MLKRLLIGLVLGFVVGGLAAAMLLQLGNPAFGGAATAYVAAAVCGVLTGLVAGKPIWSADGKIEALLKALFGALLAAGGMFALRRWAPDLPVDIAAIGASRGASIGDLPFATLPIIAGLLGAFFELDNTESSATDGRGAGGAVGINRRKGSASSPPAKRQNVRVDSVEVEDPEEIQAPPPAKKKR